MCPPYTSDGCPFPASSGRPLPGRSGNALLKSPETLTSTKYRHLLTGGATVVATSDSFGVGCVIASATGRWNVGGPDVAVSTLYRPTQYGRVVYKKVQRKGKKRKE